MPTAPPRPVKPSKVIFDPWNSSSTGHQRAENVLSGSIAWRDSRSLKLNDQFAGPCGGSKWMNDTVGAGSLDFGKDGRTANGGWEKGAKGLRRGGQQSIAEAFAINAKQPVEQVAEHESESFETQSTHVVNPFTPFRKANGKIRESSWTSHESSPSHLLSPYESDHVLLSQDPTTDEPIQDSEKKSCTGLFDHLTFYINGLTAPAISDHKLKYLITSHGGKISIAFGRRAVTHVIVGRPVSNGGSGGGLAMTKLEKEVSRGRGKPVKFVTAEWVIKSVKASARLPETRFEAMRLAPNRAGSLLDMFPVGKPKADESNNNKKG